MPRTSRRWMSRRFRKVYARHYGMIVKDGGVSCVMAAYNLIQAPASYEDRELHPEPSTC